MCKKGLLTLTLLLTFMVPTFAISAEAQIGFTSVAEIETELFDANGVKTLVRSPAKLVNPGEIAIYTNSFTNNDTQPADDLVINNPIAKNTEYLLGSATEDGYDLMFSVDGGTTFAKPEALVVTDDSGQKRPAEAKDYTNIRWTKLKSLAPGKTGKVEFRILIK